MSVKDDSLFDGAHSGYKIEQWLHPLKEPKLMSFGFFQILLIILHANGLVVLIPKYNVRVRTTNSVVNTVRSQ